MTIIGNSEKFNKYEFFEVSRTMYTNQILIYKNIKILQTFPLFLVLLISTTPKEIRLGYRLPGLASLNIYWKCAT